MIEENSKEFEFIDWIRGLPGAHSPDVQIGPGDDCAVVEHAGELLLLKVDMVLEGTHFQRSDPQLPGFATPHQVGYKAMARTISDIASMAGRPRFATIGLALPQGEAREVRQDLMHGLREAAAPFGVTIVGGDSTSGSTGGLLVSVSLTGTLDGRRPILRSGGRPGDSLYVTGRLGGSLLGRHLHPVPRVEEAIRLEELGIRAMIDLSDGLSRDLWQLCRESGCGAQIDGDCIPIHEDARKAGRVGAPGRTALEHALHDGEDFELLAAGPPLPPEPFSTPLTRIGVLTAERKLSIRIEGELAPLEIDGYEHDFGPHD